MERPPPLSLRYKRVMHSLSTAISIGALFFALFGVVLALKSAKYARDNSKASVTLRNLTSIQTELTDHADSIASLHTSLKKLRSRIGMRELRGKGGNSEFPDPNTDPQAWKDAMRERIHREKYNL
jgi:uncharacterized protein YlxW (UPF0749 family)